MDFQSCSFFTTIILKNNTADVQTSEAGTAVGPLILESCNGVVIIFEKFVTSLIIFLEICR
jgi:hypothetical protein